MEAATDVVELSESKLVTVRQLDRCGGGCRRGPINAVMDGEPPPSPASS